jgi:sugar phosphate isomerase/epimerase
MAHAPVSVSTVVIDGHDLDAGLRLIASAGVRRVEPAYIAGYMPFDERDFTEAAGRRLAERAADAGLSIGALSAHTDLGTAGAADRLARRLDLARGAGAAILISNATSTPLRAAMDRVLALRLPDFRAAGIVLGLENPGHGQDALIPDGARGAAVVAAFDDPALRLNYDIGNAHSYGARQRTARADLQAALPWTAHLHLKDLAASGADWRFCALGAGEVGYGPDLLGSLPAGLPVGIELPLRLWRPGRGDPERLADPAPPERIRAGLRQSLAALAAAGT